jgi:phage baseplate assembly protein W
METNPGERKRKPRYGVGAKSFVRKPDSQSNSDEIRRRVIVNLQDDKRTKKVVSVTVARVLINAQPVLQVQVQVDTWAQAGRKFTYQTQVVM